MRSLPSLTGEYREKTAIVDLTVDELRRTLETHDGGTRLPFSQRVDPAMLTTLIRLARPRHWIKNVFVLLPVPFALAAGAHFAPVVFLLGLGGFCLINSAVYTLNDLFDAEADRQHPTKCRRPIAAGDVSARTAIMQGAVLSIAGLGFCLAPGESLTLMPLVLAYVVINVAYNLGAKHVALLDVFLLASGFVLRVLVGCALVSAYPSSWLLLCTSTLALFLGFAKRLADLAEGLDHNHRPSLRGYSISFLEHAMVICAGVAMVSYALYSIESKVLLPGREMASMPFVAFGILNYLRMADVEGAGGSPVDIAYHSLSTQICVVGWIVAVTWSMGLW
jgi:4-hydroxybenzoate polyprenyltransferase